ncbi:MAG: SCO family protein [Spirochaetia bacterium]|nr:SCO family protein [Spirochaetia bacterium]
MRKNIFIILSAFFIVTSIANCKKEPPKLDMFPELGGDFTLTDQDGKNFNLKDLRGKAVILFFGYTNCPDVCPITLAKIGAAYKKLGDSADGVKTLFITLDPERDNSQKIKKYLSYFSYGPIGLTGRLEDIVKVTGLFKVLFVKRLTGNTNGYLFDHSTAAFLIDTKGRVRHLFGQNDRADTMATVIKVLLKQG